MSETDLISRQAAIDAILAVTGNSSVRELYEHVQEHGLSEMWSGGVNAAIDIIIAVPPAQPETHEERTETHACDCISRQAAIDIERNATVDTNPSHFEAHQKFTQFMDDAEISSFGRWQWSNGFNTALTAIGIDLKKLPSAQSERTCVNCGRTANNGGWYADGRTRCPIEEHYALPKDGYCHLWEKRNVTDDNYPERRTDE